MVKLELYIDTSVFGFLFEDKFSDKMRTTEDFFKVVKVKNFSLYISELVLLEINRIPDKNLKDKIIKVIEDFKPYVLEYNHDIEKLANEIIRMKVIPEKFIDDARHIGYAIFYEMDGIVSWNMKHIVKFSTKKIVEAICVLYNYKKIEILTPEEVIYEK
ncbi:MAG: hypothetical protein ACP5OB_06935 [Candidatus Ratteibacteria bacterium]